MAQSLTHVEEEGEREGGNEGGEREDERKGIDYKKIILALFYTFVESFISNTIGFEFDTY